MFKRIYIFFITYIIAMTATHSLLVVWFSKNGVSFVHLVASFILASLVAIALLFLSIKKINAKKAILTGLLASAVSAIVVIPFYGTWQVYLSAFVTGFNIIFFWSTYNTMHFKFRNLSAEGLSSGMLFLAGPIISVFILPIAGFLAENFGFKNLIIIGVALYSIPLILLHYLPDFELDFNIKEDIKKVGFDFGTFMQGFGMRISFSLIPIYTLFFIDTPFRFGSFFAYLSIMTIIASLINSYISDRIKNRKIFFYTFSVLSAISFTMLAFAQDTSTWQMFSAISNLCFYLAVPFWMVATLDHYEDRGVGEKKMLLREFFLNIGYIFSLGLVVVVFRLTSRPELGLGLVSLLTIFLPLSSYLQGVYRKKIHVVPIVGNVLK